MVAKYYQKKTKKCYKEQHPGTTKVFLKMKKGKQ